MEFKVLSSLAKVFADESPKDTELSHASMLQNECFSFQIAYCSDEYLEDIEINAEGELARCITMREVGLVPSINPAGTFHDDYILRSAPGLYPDPLLPFSPMKRVVKNVWRSVWVTVNPQNIDGLHTVTIVFSHPEKGELLRAELSLNIIPVSLPAQKLICTLWFHVDAIANFYHTEPYSERGFELIGKFLKMASDHGVNMILTPVFTPPLDTAVGGERLTTQLVDITRDGLKYSFDFAKLRRFIELAKNNGIKYLEISHMFTQWGAKNAPKIMAYDNGEYKKIFGWDTDAAGEEYISFLTVFIPQLLDVISSCGMEKNTYFHVSDEPSIEQLEQYQNAGEILKALIGDYPVIDALSDFTFYKTGAVSHPIPATDHIEPFLEANVPNLWTYYCVGQWNKVANRFFSMPSERSRILGIQLYKYNIAGFLQWGYNFYNVRQSLWSINPFEVTDAGGGFPSGDSFVVYPGADEPLSSLRFEVFHDAIQDMRALQLAEQLCGRDAVMAVIEDNIPPITFKEYPHDPQWLLGVREKINAMIQNA